MFGSLATVSQETIKRKRHEDYALVLSIIDEALDLLDTEVEACTEHKSESTERRR